MAINIEGLEARAQELIRMSTDAPGMRKELQRIGYYTKENELIGMSDYCYTNSSDDGRRLVFTLFFSKDSLPLSQYSDDYYYKKSWCVRVKEMCEWLLHTDGYVRIVSSVYGGGVHDVRFRLKEDEE